MLKKNPLIAMMLGFLITLTLILFMAWNLYIDKSETKRQLIQIEKVENIRLQLNEFYSDLTTLLRFQMLNPSTDNYNNYQKVVLSLQKVMRDAKIFASRNEALPIYYKLEKLQNSILKIQNQALIDIKNGKNTDVQTLLLNPTYHNMEVQYAATVLQLINANSSYQYWLTLCNDLLMYQNYQTSLMYLLNTNNRNSIQNNYHIYHTRLNQLLYQAINAANPIIDTKSFEKADQDYQQINQLNQSIFSDLKLNLTAQAKSILLSNKYINLRDDYDENIDLASKKIKSLIEEKIQAASYTHDIIAISLFIIILVFLSLWWLIIIVIKRWKNKLIQANTILDKKVEIRTKKLIEEIRAHKEAEEQKSKLETVLHQNQKLHSVGILAAGIAHDFNNLLAIILANAESLDVEKQENKEAQLGLIDAAKEAGYLTKQLLTFARKTPQHKSEANLNDLVLKSIHLLEPSLPKNIQVQQNLQHKPLQVEVDANQVTQVLLNISINAKDAMPNGGTITFSTYIKNNDEMIPENKKQGPWACIDIIDTGSGIAAEDLPYIFDPFFTKKDIDKGTGLGLATAYGIMQQHKGNIRVKSDDSGTIFTLFFPLKG